MARLPSPRHVMHRRLRLPGLRAGDDSPLRTSLRRAVRGTCRSRRLSTPRRRRCDPNATFPTRSPRCADASPMLSSNAYHDAHAAKHQCQHAHNGGICDTVKLGRLRLVYGLDAIENLAEIALGDLNVIVVLQIEPKLC